MELTACPITDQAFEHYERTKEGYCYRITFLGKQFDFLFCEKCLGKIPFEDIRPALRGLLLGGQLDVVNGKAIHWGSSAGENQAGVDLKELLNSFDFPRTPGEKIDNLITELFKLQKHDGQVIVLDQLFKGDWNRLFFRNLQEFVFYLETLARKGDIEIKRDGGSPKSFNFTYQGITNYIKKQTEGFSSKRCFVAIAFLPEMKPVRESIKSALIQTGFEPVLVDEKDIDSDRTINDVIIASLRQCKFCIADFSHHRMGVYFESGFALGQGKQVIYLCSKEHFDQTHFDIKPLQHIIYESSEELEQRLVDKIEAWVK